MTPFELKSSSISGLTHIPLDPPEDVFGALWRQAVDDFMLRAQLSTDEKALICHRSDPAEIFALTKRRWNNLNDKQLRRHEKAQKAVDTVLMIFNIIDGALGLAQVVCLSAIKLNPRVGLSCFLRLLRSAQTVDPGSGIAKPN